MSISPQVRLDNVLNQLAFIIGGLNKVSEYCKDDDISPVDGCVELLYSLYDAVKSIKEDLSNTTIENKVVTEVEEETQLPIIPLEDTGVVDKYEELMDRFKDYHLSDKELGLSLMECKILGYMEVTNNKGWFRVSDIVNNTHISRSTVVKYLKKLRDLNITCSAKINTNRKIGNIIWWALTDKYKNMTDIIVFISYKLHRYMVEV